MLQTYLDSLPYECESVEDMQAHLEYIVGKITTCAKSKNWLVLTTWDGALQWSVIVDHTVIALLNCSPKLAIIALSDAEIYSS